MNRSQVVRVFLTLCVMTFVSVREGSAQPEPTLPGSAVLHVSPVEADTLPILCRDADHPELGFVTEMSDSDWTPRYDLTLEPTIASGEEVSIELDMDGAAYGATFPVIPNDSGFLTAVAWVARPGASERQISFTAQCSERLVRS